MVYLISGFRWSFFEVSDVSVGLSLSMVLVIPGRLPAHGVVDVQEWLSLEAVGLYKTGLA